MADERLPAEAWRAHREASKRSDLKEQQDCEAQGTRNWRAA